VGAAAGAAGRTVRPPGAHSSPVVGRPPNAPQEKAEKLAAISQLGQQCKEADEAVGSLKRGELGRLPPLRRRRPPMPAALRPA
jgi:hypothetical protein